MEKQGMTGGDSHSTAKCVQAKGRLFQKETASFYWKGAACSNARFRKKLTCIESKLFDDYIK